MRVLVILSALFAVTCAAPQNNYQHHEHHEHLGPQHEKYLPPSAPTLAPTVLKQFYIISAPEDGDSQPKTKHLVLGRPQKNYRVVFIKAPHGGDGKVKYSAEFAPQEEKTVIYVLSKKDNELDAGDIATPAPVPASKPEVFFIKYKTDDEAQQAQSEIRGEYDKLGGINEVAAETTSPITSVVGSYNYRPHSNAGQASKKHHVVQAPASQYLPSLLKY